MHYSGRARSAAVASGIGLGIVQRPSAGISPRTRRGSYSAGDLVKPTDELGVKLSVKATVEDYTGDVELRSPDEAKRNPDAAVPHSATLHAGYVAIRQPVAEYRARSSFRFQSSLRQVVHHSPATITSNV
jgi:hypothetical protein